MSDLLNSDLTSKNLPVDVKEIEFDTSTPLNLTASFNKSIDNLPDTIEKIFLSAGFN